MSEEKPDEKKETLVKNTEEQTFELSRVLRFILVSSFILLNITYSADVGVIASSKFNRKNSRYFYLYGIINKGQ